mgnify:CR=1 FL=1
MLLTATANARGEVLMILDADLTVPPEDLTKFYNAIASGKGEFIKEFRPSGAREIRQAAYEFDKMRSF